MIEMICGTYGGRDGLRKVGDDPFSLPAEEERRLVMRGAARYIPVYLPNVAPVPVATPHTDDDQDDSSDTSPDSNPATEDDIDDRHDVETPDVNCPSYGMDMKADQLRAIMEQFGLTFKVGMTKANMVAALDEYLAEVDDESEAPPDIGAEAPVV